MAKRGLVCVILTAGHAQKLSKEIKDDKSGRYAHLKGIPKALLPSPRGKRILDHWWDAINTRQLFINVFLVTNADKYKHFERWATASDFPVENIINDGSTTEANSIGAAAGFELALQVKNLWEYDILVIAGDMLFQDSKFDIAQVIDYFHRKPDGDLAIYYEMEKSEHTTSRGIVEVCPKSNRILKFLEKPLPEETESRNASVVFYTFRSDTAALVPNYLKEHPDVSQRTFGAFMKWLINEQKVMVFGMKLPTGFQLIGQVGLKDYEAWVSYFADQAERECRDPITMRAYSRIALTRRNFTLSYDTNIPRQIGLAGSSAIVTAALKCLMAFYNLTDQDMAKTLQPQFILDVEKEELRINAGLQDRVVQIYEGLVYMDFTQSVMEKKGHGLYSHLNVVLPPLFLAYLSTSSDSDRIHSDMSLRWQRGEEEVINGMQKLADLTDRAAEAIQCSDWCTLADLMNENFNVRLQLYTHAVVGEENLRMINIGRKFGAGVKLPGSGGAVIGLLPDQTLMEEMRREYQKEGCVVVDIIPKEPEI
ncbi:uncharacterized protein [Panulirus ornatus]|uniref:uncharacterized protein isoform X4 n=1 Tax=Panulirus ornatus TaxID=150431 RepID=UPI003A857A36